MKLVCLQVLVCFNSCAKGETIGLKRSSCMMICYNSMNRETLHSVIS